MTDRVERVRVEGQGRGLSRDSIDHRVQQVRVKDYNNDEPHGEQKGGDQVDNSSDTESRVPAALVEKVVRTLHDLGVAKVTPAGPAACE